MGIDPSFICARAAPKFSGYLDWVDTGLLPPCSLVACTMNRAVVDAAEWHREFIAGLTSERPWLHVPKMMRVRWLAAANEAGLSGNKAQVLPVAIAARRQLARSCRCLWGRHFQSRKLAVHLAMSPLPPGHCLPQKRRWEPAMRGRTVFARTRPREVWRRSQ